MSHEIFKASCLHAPIKTEIEFKSCELKQKTKNNQDLGSLS